MKNVYTQSSTQNRYFVLLYIKAEIATVWNSVTYSSWIKVEIQICYRINLSGWDTVAQPLLRKTLGRKTFWRENKITVYDIPLLSYK